MPTQVRRKTNGQSRNAVQVGKAAKASLRKARKATLDGICLRIEEA